MSHSSTFSRSAHSFRSLRIIGWLITLAAFTLLQACSAVKLAYNNAPEFAFWWLDAYVDFNDSQSPLVRTELARLLQWHRTDELPKIADLLQKVQRLAVSDIAPAQVCAVYADARERYNAVVTQAEPAAVTLAMSLKPDQIKHIQGKFNKGNDEYRREWMGLNPAERLEKRLKANIERAEEFYGKLEDRQVGILKTALEASTFDSTLGFAERQRRQQDFFQTLKNVSGKSNQTEVLLSLRGYMDRAVNSPNLAYRTYSDRLAQESCASFSLLHGTTTTEQRTRAVRRLAAYERDARELSLQRP